MFEVTTSWALPSGIPTKSYMYFDAVASIAQIRARLGTFFNAVQGSLSNTVFWSVDPEGKVLNPVTGALVSEWADATAIAGQGTGAAQVVADATQINLQWNTGVVINGRFLKGRTYIPGLAAAALSNGNLASANRTALTAAGNALAAAPEGLRVWHRPVNGFGGSEHPVTGAICRSELAVLRKRRNRST